MLQQFNKLGILGGTFNPIHNGHLIAAESVRESLKLDKVIFMTSGRPPHKNDEQVADAEDRYEMVRRAIASNPYFEASRIELDRKGYTYTVDTLRALKEKYGDSTKIYFIIGADIVDELTTWKEYENVFKLCEFAAVMRPGYNTSKLEADIKRLKEQYDVGIHTVTIPLIDISSTDIRERCAVGRSIKYLVTDETERYILQHDLYKKDQV
jgi:nicotinate-nucleotide adenylyltransferase